MELAVPAPTLQGPGGTPHQRLQNGPQPPASGDWGSRELITVLGCLFPSSAQGEGGAHDVLDAHPSDFSPAPLGEKANSDASERDGNTSPRPLTGGEVPISTRDAGICTLLPASQGEKSSPRASPAKVYAAPISAPRRKMPHTSAACIPIDLDTATGKTRVEPGHL